MSILEQRKERLTMELEDSCEQAFERYKQAKKEKKKKPLESAERLQWSLKDITGKSRGQPKRALKKKQKTTRNFRVIFNLYLPKKTT